MFVADYTEEKCMSREKDFVLPVCCTVYVFLACIANGGAGVLRTREYVIERRTLTATPLKNKMVCLNFLMSNICNECFLFNSSTHQLINSFRQHLFNALNVLPLNTQMTLQIVQQSSAIQVT